MLMPIQVQIQSIFVSDFRRGERVVQAVVKKLKTAIDAILPTMRLLKYFMGVPA